MPQKVIIMFSQQLRTAALTENIMPQKVIIIFSQQLRTAALTEFIMPQKVIIMFSQQLRISAVKTPAQHFAMIHGKCSPLTGALTRFLTGCPR